MGDKSCPWVGRSLGEVNTRVKYSTVRYRGVEGLRTGPIPIVPGHSWYVICIIQGIALASPADVNLSAAAEQLGIPIVKLRCRTKSHSLLVDAALHVRL